MKAEIRTLAIDTNVILRYLLRDDPKLSPRAKSVFDAMRQGHVALLCDPVILAEAVWVMTKVYRLSREQISSPLRSLMEADGFIMRGKQRYVHALELFATTVPHFGDACVCAAAQESCQGRLLSFDKKLSGVDGVVRAESVEV